MTSCQGAVFMVLQSLNIVKLLLYFCQVCLYIYIILNNLPSYFNRQYEVYGVVKSFISHLTVNTTSPDISITYLKQTKYRVTEIFDQSQSREMGHARSRPILPVKARLKRILRGDSEPLCLVWKIQRKRVIFCCFLKYCALRMYFYTQFARTWLKIEIVSKKKTENKILTC